MQPVFFVSLFSLVFLMFSSMTNGITKNIMQANIERVENTIKMFNEVETVINKVIFQDAKIVDFSDTSYLELAGDYISAKSSYSKSELSKDAWNNKVYLLKTTEHMRIWGAPGGQYADAPISHFILVSAGPNQRYDLFRHWGYTIDTSSTSNIIAAGGAISSDDIKTVDITDVDVIGDDVVVRFNNYDSMYNLWEKAESLDTMVRDVALEYYKNSVDAFSPLIQFAQRDKDLNSENNLGYDIFDDSLFNSIGFDPFNQLQQGTSTSFQNEWNTIGADDSDIKGLLHTMLAGGTYTGSTPARNFEGYRVAKEYEDEFKITNPNVENEFKSFYNGVKFLYPSYDVLDYSSSGSYMASGRGLENLGIPSLESLDPFYGKDGEIDYTYDRNLAPHKIIVVRESANAGNANKWNIKKQYEINGLGD